jgi:hypothetical protein
MVNVTVRAIKSQLGAETSGGNGIAILKSAQVSVNQSETYRAVTRFSPKCHILRRGNWRIIREIWEIAGEISENWREICAPSGVGREISRAQVQVSLGNFQNFPGNLVLLRGWPEISQGQVLVSLGNFGNGRRNFRAVQGNFRANPSWLEIHPENLWRG